VAIAKRIERGQLKTQKAISRSPIAVRELLKIGEELQSDIANILEVVIFSDRLSSQAMKTRLKNTEPGPRRVSRISVRSLRRVERLWTSCGRTESDAW